MASLDFASSFAVLAEPVEARACGLIWRRACAQGGSRVVAPAGDSLSFASPKERRPPVCDPFAALRGKPAAGRLRGAPWNSLCAARAARTATASQSTRHGRFDAHAHPTTAPPQAQPAGGWAAEQPRGPLLRSAPPRGRKRHALRRPGRAKQWPVWMSAPRVPFRMRRGAQRPADQGSRLSERNAVERVGARPRWTRAPQVARSEAQGRSLQGRLFFGDFLLAKQKKATAPPGAHPGPRPWQNHASNYKNNS